MILLIATLDFIAAYFIYKLKLIGRTLGIISGILEVLPAQTALLILPFIRIFSLFSDNPLIYATIPGIIILIIFLIILIILTNNKHPFKD